MMGFGEKMAQACDKWMRVLLAVSLMCFVAVPATAVSFVSSAFAQQAQPVLASSFSVSAEYGDSLHDYALPAGWSWDNGSSKLTVVGTTTASATYHSSNPGYDKNYASGVTVDVPITVSPRVAQIMWGPTTLAYLGKEVKVKAYVANAAFKGDSFALEFTGNAATKIGSYKATVISLGNSNYKLPDDASEVSTAWSIKALETGENGTVVGGKTGCLPSDSGWLSETASIVAPEGYEISPDAASWDSSMAVKSKEGTSQVTYYLREVNTEYVTDAKTITVKQDTVAPVIKSAKATPAAKSVSISVSAKDATSGIKKYSITGTPAKASVSESGGNFSIGGLKAKTSYNFTVKVTDNAGNVAVKNVKFITKGTGSSKPTAGGSGSSRPSGTFSDQGDDGDELIDDWSDAEFVDEEWDDGEEFVDDGSGEGSDDGDFEEGEWIEGEDGLEDAGIYADGEEGESAEGRDIDFLPLIIALGIILASILARWAYDAGRRKLSATIAAEVAAQLALAGIAGAAAGSAGAGAAGFAAAGAAAGAAGAEVAGASAGASNAAAATVAMPVANTSGIDVPPTVDEL